MSNESTAQIVERIIESLSEAVSQLVILVIALQEQNAEMPAQLPTAANGVAGASGTLVNVATALANEEYEDYPEIQNQMLVAVDGVKNSSSNMIKAVNNMQTTKDRKAGWNQLVDACKVIAGKTILLLQIVYGAELRRLFAAADLADDALNKLNSGRAGDDPEDFAAKAGDAATKANQLAEYLDDKAKDVKAPGQKKALQKAADDLRDDARNLINAANDLLADPDNPQKKKKFDDVLQKTKDDIRRGKEPIRDDLDQAERNIDSLQDQSKGDPNFNRLFPTPKSKTKDAEDSLDDDALIAAANRAGDLGDRLEAVAKRGDPKGVEDAIKDLDNAHNQIKNQAKNPRDDPVQKRRIQDAIDDLDRLLPEQKNAARNLAKNPQDKPSREKLEDANRKAKDALDDLGDAVRPGHGLGKAVDDLDRSLGDLEQSARRGDPAGNDAAARRVGKDKEPVVKRGKEVANKQEDPARKKDVLDAVSNLESLLPQEIAKSKAVANNPSDKKAARDLDDVGDKIRDALGTLKAAPNDADDKDKLAAAANQAKKAADRLRDAAKKGDKPGVNNAGNDLQRALDNLAEPARREADKSDHDPIRKRKMLDALNDLERLLPDDLRAARDASDKPRDPQARKHLDDTTDDLLDALARVQAPSNPASPVLAAAEKTKRKEDDLDDAMKAGDPKGIEDAGKALRKAHDDLQDKGRDLAKHKDDPARRRDLGDALDDLEDALPKQVKNANKARDNPRDPKNKKDYDDAARKGGDALDDVIAAARPKPKDDAQQAAEDLEDDLDRMGDAAEDGNVPKAAAAGKDAVGDADRLAAAARKEAARTNNPKKKKDLLDAIDKLEAALPDAINSGKDASKNPKDPRKQKKYKDDAAKVNNAADDILKAIADSPDDALAAAANRAARDADKLAHGAKDGNPQAMKRPTQTLGRTVPKLKEDGNKLANKSKPEKKKKLNDALTNVDDSFPEHIKSARNVAQDPSNPAKRQAMDDANDDLQDALRNVANAASPENPDVAIRDAYDRIGPAAQATSAAAKKGDQAGLQDPLGDLEDATRKLAAGGKKAAGRTDDPTRRRALDDALKDLDDLLRNLRPDAENAARNPNDKRAQDKLDADLKKLKDAADKVADAAQSKPLADAEEQEKDLDRLGQAARRKDPKGISDAFRSIADRAPKLADQARKEAQNTKDPAKRKQISDALDDLDKLLPSSLGPAAVKAAQNPNDKAAQKGLEDAVQDYRDGLHDLNKSMRPTPEDQLAHDADRAKEALGRVGDAARAGKPKDTDDRLRDLDDPLDDVLNHGKSLARKEPNPKKKRQLEDALRDVERQDPPVHSGAKNLAKNPNDPNSQRNYDDPADKMKKALDNIANTASPSHNKKQRKQLGGDIDKLEDLLPRVQKAADNFRKNPNDPKARKELEDLLDQLEDPASKLADFLGDSHKPTPNENIARDAKDLAKAFDDIENAARRGDPKGLADAARRAADQQKDLAPRIKQAAEKERDPNRRKGMLDALEDLERLLPQNIRAAQKVASNPRDVPAKRELGDTNDDLKGAARRLADAADPPAEQAIRDAAQRIKEEGPKLVDAAKKGDKKNGQNALDNLKDAAQTLANKGREDAARTKDPARRRALDDALKALDDLLGDLEDDAAKALDNPRDAGAQKKLGDDVKNLGDLADKIVEATRSKPISKAQNEGQAADEISAAAKRKDPKTVAEATKKLVENTPALIADAKNEANKENDPKRKKDLLDSISDLEKLLPQTVPAVKNAISNPDDKDKQDELRDLLSQYKGPVAKISNALKPSDDNEAEALAREADAALAEIAAKAKKGDQPGVDNALKKLREPVNKLKTMGKKVADTTSDPTKKKSLQDALDALDKLLNDLDKTAKDAAKNPKDKNKQDELDDVIHQVKKPIETIVDAVKDDIQDNGKANRRAASILASLKAAKKKRMDPRTLLEAADELAATLRDMLGDVKTQAYAEGASTPAAGQALALNDLLSQLEKASTVNKKPAQKESLSSLLDGLSALADAVAPPPGATLEQSINWVAETLNKRSRQLADDPTSKYTTSLSNELAKLAEAVRKGARSEFLISARTIAAYINQYYNEVQALANNCSDPVLKDRLIQNGQALKNFSVQLKILASVKAASTGDDPAAEAQLGILIQNMGQMMNATINNVQIYRIKNRK